MSKTSALIRLQDALDLFQGDDTAGPKPSAIRAKLESLPIVAPGSLREPMSQTELNFAVSEKEEEIRMAVESLNFYRNQYHAESVVTEQGRIAQDINTILPLFVRILGMENAK